MKNLFFVLPFLAIVQSHREHKVHNIVLYPDKQSWCKTTPIKQVVGEPGYESTTVENSVCVGTCFSYSIPHTSDISITPYCDSCQPSETHWFHVTLEKLANADEEMSEYPNQDISTPLPDTIKKQVQIITNCTCLSCTEQLNNQRNFHDEDTVELPKSLLANNKKPSKTWDEIVDEAESKKEEASTEDNSKSQSFEIPDLLQLVNRTKSHRNETRSYVIEDYHNVTDAQRYLLNTRLTNLLKNIQNYSLNDDVRTENDFKFDPELLSELLKIIEGSENHLNDKNLMEFVNFVNVHNSEDFELDLSRLKTVLEQYQSEQKTRGKLASLEYAALHKHFAGEHINLADDVAGGHLVPGPHGSLIIQPDGIEEKLNMDPNLLRPNHEGTVIRYEVTDKNKIED